ncbi:uncharacterized protein [Argopecten irradians]|uniref:uncharacterized protein isoform X3 n=1 Tax=Argopecten irradians TaxID=31199 RepID=UPI003717D909
MSTRQQFLLDSDDISSHEFRIDDKPGRTYRIVQRYTLKTVSIVFLTLLVIIETSIIVCWSLSASKTSTRQDNASDQVPNRDLDSLCFPCNAIGKNISSSDMGHIIRFDKETNLCCMEDVGNLKNFFLLIINEYYRNVEANSSESSLDRKDETATNSTESEDSDEVQVGAVAGHVGGSNSKHLKLKAPYISEPGNKVKDFWTKREAAAHMFLDNALLRNTNNTGGLKRCSEADPNSEKTNSCLLKQTVWLCRHAVDKLKDHLMKMRWSCTSYRRYNDCHDVLTQLPTKQTYRNGDWTTLCRVIKRS